MPVDHSLIGRLTDVRTFYELFDKLSVEIKLQWRPINSDIFYIIGILWSLIQLLILVELFYSGK